MHADSYFVQGRSHRICEDYALTGLSHGRPFAVVCDGCSSSPHTDFGARILAHSFKDAFNTFDLDDYGDLPPIALAQAQVHAKSLGLDLTCLDCTLLAVWVDGENAYTLALGDGGCVVEFRNGIRWCMHWEFPSGAPRYLSYDLDQKRLAQYLEEYGEKIVERSFAIMNDKVTDRQCCEYSSRTVMLSPYLHKTNEVRAIGVFSDGAATFRNRDDGTAEPVEGAVSLMTDFKTTTGAFVQRRMKRLMKFYEDAGFAPEDDVSFAAIHVGDE